MRKIPQVIVRAWIGLVAAALAWALLSPLAHARYMRPDLEDVSIHRLIANVTRQAEAKPDDPGVWFRLARLHAMAYASKSDTAQVNRRISKDDPWFGYEPPFVPYPLKTTQDQVRLKEARRHLESAIQTHEKVLKLRPGDSVARLGYAWCLEQAGKTREAVAQYRRTIDEAWKTEKGLEHGSLGGHYLVAEAGGYLIPILDKDKDAEEIATLKQRITKLKDLPRPITPIAIPLRAGLRATEIVDARASVAFDADGSGRLNRWTWITPDAGWLVTDPRGRGQVGSALQLFGNVSFWLFWDNGFQAMAALDDNGDGRLTGDELRGLAVWRDANGNGISEPGEVRPLDQWGIVELSCRHETDASHADRIKFSREGAVFSDGAVRPTFDVILHPKPARRTPQPAR